jgi:hypothetical protein
MDPIAYRFEPGGDVRSGSRSPAARTGAFPIVSGESWQGVAITLPAGEPAPATIPSPVVADEPDTWLVDDGNFVPPGDGSYLFDPANWSFDVVRDDGPAWIAGQPGLHGSPHANPGRQLSLLIQAMAAMPGHGTETAGVVAVEPLPAVFLAGSL